MRETLIAAVVALIVLVATQAWMDRRERLRRKAEAAEADRREFTDLAAEALAALHDLQREVLGALRLADAIVYRGGTFLSSTSKGLRADLEVAVVRARVAQTQADGVRERLRLYRRDDHPVAKSLESALTNCRRLTQQAETTGAPREVRDADGVLMSETAVLALRETEPQVDHVREALSKVIDPDRRAFAGEVREERRRLRGVQASDDED